MRSIREALRLCLQAGLSYGEAGRTLKLSKSVVGKYMSLARMAGVDYELAQTLSDEVLEARLFRPAVPRASHQLTPDFAAVHQELKRPGVTLMLLWEEYARDNPLAYKYTSFCITYRAFAKTQQRSMRQIHVAGEKLFVDYAGDTVPITDAATGEITRAQIFVATLGASNYAFACATPRQTTEDWIGAQVLALEFFGGVTRLIVPDQASALIKSPDRYDPQPNRDYEEFASHYGTVILAARPAHPRDKPKVEATVLLVQRWILARLRNRRFFHLAELNRAIAELLVDLNNRPFKKLPGCRRSAFETIDAPALKPLPARRFVIKRWKSAKVNIDYHIEFEGHYYSVPHRLVGARLELRAGAGLLECFASNQRVASHPLSALRGKFTTTPDHMPASHRAHRQWTPAKLIGAPPPSRAGLPRLPGPAGAGQALHGRAAGGRLHARHGDSRAPSEERHQHPQEWSGPPEFAACRRRASRHRARQRSRARLLPLTLSISSTHPIRFTSITKEYPC